MTRPDGDRRPDQPLDPEREAQVRRLLAAARHDEPVPDHVATRLDRVLDDLSARRQDPASPTTREGSVVSLAARRRRRLATSMVAAAAVVAVGVGVGELVRGGDAAPAASQDEMGQDDGASEPHTMSGTDARGPAAAEVESAPVAAVELATDDAVARRQLSGLANELRARAVAVADLPCWQESWGPGVTAWVVRDGRDGVAVFGPDRAGHRRVRVWVCTSEEPVLSGRVPVR